MFDAHHTQKMGLPVASVILKHMTGFLIFAGVLVVVVLVFRHWRKREIEAFLAADMSAFEGLGAIGEQLGPVDLPVTSGSRETNVVDMPADDKTVQSSSFGFHSRDTVFDDVYRSCLSTLEEVVGDNHRLYVHVPLVDLVRAEDAQHRRRLEGETVSFAVCEKPGMSLVCGIQLKGAGHSELSRHAFIQDVFRQIEKPLITLPMLTTYSPIEVGEKLRAVLSEPPLARHCPRCGKAMMMRKAVKGRNAGKTFWVCREFPSCKGITRIGS